MVSLEEDEYHLVDPNKSFNIENERNNYRNQLKDQNVLDVNNKEYNYQTGVHYMDIISECEKLGFKRVILPQGNKKGLAQSNIRLDFAQTLRGALKLCFEETKA